MKKARAEDTLNSIREVTALLYNGFGEDITPEEQIAMIDKMIQHYKGNTK